MKHKYFFGFLLLLSFATLPLTQLQAQDFDESLSPEDCAQNVIRNVQPGSIVVFHDSEKAWPKLKNALPEVLKHLNEQGIKSCGL